MTKKHSKVTDILAPIVAIVFILAVWELLTRLLHVPERLLPAP